METWKDIFGYEGLYQISNRGRLKSLVGGWRKSEKILKSCHNTDGYLIIGLYKDKKRKTKRVARLIAEAFISNPNNKPQINHKNGIKTDDRIDNLEWVTSSENHQHAFRVGIKSQKGEKHNRTHLTEKDILVIHGLYLSKTFNQMILSRIYRINQQGISKILLGSNWNYFDGVKK